MVNSSLLYYIPVPPSVNTMWTNNLKYGKGRIKSKKYREWQELTKKILIDQNIKEVPFKNISLSLFIERPNRRCDIDNRIKAIPDILQHCGIIKNDSIVEEIRAKWIPKGERSFFIIQDAS